MASTEPEPVAPMILDQQVRQIEEQMRKVGSFVTVVGCAALLWVNMGGLLSRHAYCNTLMYYFVLEKLET